MRAVFITGEGESFCAGADFKVISRKENLFHPEHGEWGFASYLHQFIGKPTIAAVNEATVGGGAEVALARDLMVAQERAKFVLLEVKRGVIAAAGGVFRILVLTISEDAEEGLRAFAEKRQPVWKAR